MMLMNVIEISKTVYTKLYVHRCASIESQAKLKGRRYIDIYDDSMNSTTITIQEQDRDNQYNNLCVKMYFDRIVNKIEM
jgi:hypothetical protein